jgi:hypothetical protein
VRVPSEDFNLDESGSLRNKNLRVLAYRDAELMYFKTTLRGRKLKPGRIKPVGRYGLAIVGLLVMLGSVLKIFSGNQHYANSRGVLTFAPFSIIIGSLLILLAVRSRK